MLPNAARSPRQIKGLRAKLVIGNDCRAAKRSSPMTLWVMNAVFGHIGPRRLSSRHRVKALSACDKNAAVQEVYALLGPKGDVTLDRC